MKGGDIMVQNISFNARCLSSDTSGNSLWRNPDGTVQVLNANDSIEFIALQSQVLCAKRLKAALE